MYYDHMHILVSAQPWWPNSPRKLNFLGSLTENPIQHKPNKISLIVLPSSMIMPFKDEPLLDALCTNHDLKGKVHIFALINVIKYKY